MFISKYLYGNGGTEISADGTVFIGTFIGIFIGYLLFFVLGIYLIRKGIINGSTIQIVIGVLFTGLIGLLLYLIWKDSPSLKKKREEKLKKEEQASQNVAKD